MVHPSALEMFEQITNASKGKKIVMFLDYDGTLSPIVEDPDRAYMSDAMRTTVRKRARYFPTAIVSGRCRDKALILAVQLISRFWISFLFEMVKKLHGAYIIRKLKKSPTSWIHLGF
ncbi:hypothetical protein CsSME_00038731 [Camellia sinensis var. sinensis]